MIAEDFLALFTLAGEPITAVGNRWADWYDGMDYPFRIASKERMDYLWARTSFGQRNRNNWLWCWACACEYAWRNDHDRAMATSIEHRA